MGLFWRGWTGRRGENINFFDAINVDIDAEIAQLGPSGDRPLRSHETLS